MKRKGSESKRAEIKERARSVKEFGTGNHIKKKKTNKKSPNFWLMRMRQIRILSILAPNRREIYHFSKMENGFLRRI